MSDLSPSKLAHQGAINPRLLNGALWLGIIVTALVVLRDGKDFFIPLLIALIAVYLITVLSRLARHLRIAGRQLPVALTMILSFAVIFGFGYAIFEIVAVNALKVADEAPHYQARLIQLQERVFDSLGIDEPDASQQFIRSLDLRTLFTTVGTTLLNILGRVSLVLLYSLFILLELRFLQLKLDTLFPDPARRSIVLDMLRRIDRDIHTYLGVKTAISIITAAISYAIMRAVNLSFAEFWALLIFILNYIPTIGSLIATLLPTLLALVQFPDNLTPFLVVGIGISTVQQLMGTIIEPNLMGQTLNLSPLVVFVSLILWGYIWGIVGMFICVPITVILVIILSNFESTRWVSILLSKTGNVRSS